MTDRRRERIRSCLHPGSEEWDDLDALVADRDRYKAMAEWLAARAQPGRHNYPHEIAAWLKEAWSDVRGGA